MDKKWWTLLIVSAATFMLLLDVTIVVVALPEIQKGLHTNFSDVQWVIDAYALTLASLLLTAGSLADRYGRRLLFMIGLIVFTLGSLTCGLAQSPLMLILSRSAQGIGCGHRSRRRTRANSRRRDHQRDQLARYLPR
jgi:MFS family permease